MANSVANAIGFARHVALRISARPGEAILVPETDADNDLLKGLAPDGVHAEYRTTVATTLRLDPHPELMRALVERPAALRLYNDSLSLPTAASRFRELWRVLEAAWQRKNDDLVVSMSRFQPAIDRGYTKQGLHELLVLRGRASHAESRAGINEIIRVERLAAEQEGLLRSLVQEVIVTKKNWGSRDNAAERIHPLARAGAWTAP